jgi:hypothetical protein
MMQDQRDDGRELNESSEANEGQQPLGQDSSQNEYGEIDSAATAGSGAMPPRSMGTRSNEFGQFGDQDDGGQQGQSGTGQADLGSQAGSTLSGHTDQQELGDLGGGVDQPASYGGGVGGGQADPQGEGFILQQGTGSDDLRQDDSGLSTEATEGADFAPQGQGAVEDIDESGSSGGA